MKHSRQGFLRTIPATLALMVAAATVQAQQAEPLAPAQAAQPAQQQTMPASAAENAPVQVDATAVTHDSSDQNVPPATARKQAAEIASGDPQRWYREDTTSAARLRTIQKEIAAGLQEAQGNCRRRPTAERAACMKDARAIYQKEMAEARSKAMAGMMR